MSCWVRGMGRSRYFQSNKAPTFLATQGSATTIRFRTFLYPRIQVAVSNRAPEMFFFCCTSTPCRSDISCLACGCSSPLGARLQRKAGRC